MKRSIAGYTLALMTIFFGVIAVAAQQNDREAGMKAFEADDYTKSIDLLKKAAKSKDADAKIWSVLGLAYLKKDKGKDAAKAMNKAVEMEPKNDVYVAGLAVVYLVYGDSRASKTAYTALEINPKSIDGHYVLGTIALQAGSYLSAYQRANRIIELKPDFAPAYGLRSQALVGSYSAYVGVVDKAPEKKYELLIEAASDLEKFLELTPEPKVKKDYEGQVKALKYFAEYYSHPENRPAPSIEAPAQNDPSKTPIKILRKPRPSYTDSARQRSVQGMVKLLVTFGGDGRIGPIMILKSLDRDLDVQAILAARGISFTPATLVGQPVSVVKMVEYSFAIY